MNKTPDHERRVGVGPNEDCDGDGDDNEPHPNRDTRHERHRQHHPRLSTRRRSSRRSDAAAEYEATPD
jgi:hypothetical protein